jgi:hypothetical protein
MMVDIIFFDSWEDAMEAERRAQERAAERTKPTQLDIKPGQYIINCRYFPDLPIFSEILDISKLGHDEEEQRYIDEVYGQPHMKYYRPTKAYSSACLWGEIGDIHVSEISVIIDKELFDWYKSNGWSKPRK